jgi:hypothetical protein
LYREVAGPGALALLASAVWSMSGCGDPILPADFSGPPAAAVGGNVVPGTVGTSKDADRPLLTLEWLSQERLGRDWVSEDSFHGKELGIESHSLIGQSVSFRRSERLETDWDIGLALPSESAKFNDVVASGLPVRIAVGKMVYFDDRTPDGKLDWSCQGAGCDEVKAVSDAFVVYVDNPPTCQSGEREWLLERPLVPAGYNYYAFDGTTVRPMARDQPLTFALVERSLSEANPTLTLRSFADALLRRWTLSALGGCELDSTRP